LAFFPLQPASNTTVAKTIKVVICFMVLINFGMLVTDFK
jgi:hypothetical protein